MFIECFKVNTRELYNGSLLVVKQVPALKELIKFTSQEFLHEDAFEGFTEKQRQETMKLWEQQEISKQLWKETLEYCGFNLETTSWDRIRLRLQPPNQNSFDNVSDLRFSKGRFSTCLPVHRDTWGSNISCQINVWAPIQNVNKERTLALYPDFFQIPVPNTSHEWSFSELKRHRKQNKPYPQLPVLQDNFTFPPESRLPVLLSPGDLLFFSSAHLHQSIINKTTQTRVSTEVRILDEHDFRKKSGAPNCDNSCTEVCSSWFSNIASSESLEGK